jgi:hypothetical protein
MPERWPVSMVRIVPLLAQNQQGCKLNGFLRLVKV